MIMKNQKDSYRDITWSSYSDLGKQLGKGSNAVSSWLHIHRDKTVYDYIDLCLDGGKRFVSNKEKDVEIKAEEQAKKKEEPILVIGKRVVVGMIKDRHDMPVSKYILNGALEDTFNYNAIDSQISAFILNNMNITKDAGIYKSEKALTVYVTGLTCVTASIIKMCSNYNVPLTLMHFNASNNSYDEQIIFPYTSNSSNKLENIFSAIYKNDTTYVMDCDEEYLLGGGEFYLISYKQFNGIKTKSRNYEGFTNYLYKNKDQMYKKYLESLQMLHSSTIDGQIIVETCKISHSKISCIARPLRTCNYRTYDGYCKK